MSVDMHTGSHTCIHMGDGGKLKRILDPLMLELWAAVCRIIWMLGTKLWPSARAADAFHCSAVSQVKCLDEIQEKERVLPALQRMQVVGE